MLQYNVMCGDPAIVSGWPNGFGHAQWVWIKTRQPWFFMVFPTEDEQNRLQRESNLPGLIKGSGFWPSAKWMDCTALHGRLSKC